MKNEGLCGCSLEAGGAVIFDFERSFSLQELIFKSVQYWTDVNPPMAYSQSDLD
jgi:hypothetical protein